MKKIKVLSILGVVLGVLIVYVLGRFLLRNYIDAKKLVEAIKNEDLYATEQIINKNPECINTYPSITSKGWHSAMNWRVCYPLNEACLTGNMDLIELLIKNGADVNCNDGLTPLSVIYSSKIDNWYEISQILIEKGASLNYITDYSGGKSSVLQDIVQVRSGAASPGYKPESKEEVIKAFYYALENVNHNNVNWMRVLQHSVSNDRIEIVKLLLEQEYCTVNDTSVGMTALMFAARDSTTEMVQLLLDYGADKDYISSNGKTAYDYAVQSDNQEIIDLLS